MQVRSRFGFILSVFRQPGRFLIVLLLLAVIGLGLVLAGRNLWANWHERKGRQQAARYDFDAAFYHFEQSLRIWNGNPAVHIEAARAARRARKFDKVEEHLKMSQKLQGTSAEQQLERLLLEAQTGDLASAEGKLKEYINPDRPDVPEAPLVWEALADSYLRVNRDNEAETLLDKLLAKEPNNILALYLKGRLLAKTSRGDEAKIVLERVLQLQPNHLEAHNDLSRLLLLFEPAAALEHIRFLRARQPRDSSLKFRHLQCCKALGQTEEAIELLDELLAEAPDDPLLLVERGILASEMSDAVGAEKWLRKVLVLDPNHHEANYRLAQALLQQVGKKAEAQALLDRCGRLKRIGEIVRMGSEKLSKSAALLHEGGTLLLRVGKEKEGLVWLYRALDVDPYRLETHRVLAGYYEKTGQLEQWAKHQRFLQKQDQ